VTSLLLVAACGAPVTGGTGEAQPSSDGGTAETTDSFVDLYAQLDGLEGEERTAKLIELANKEGTLNIYTSNTQMEEFADEFTDKYKDAGLDVQISVYRAPANTVLQRLLEEGKAGYAGADLAEIHSKEMTALSDAGILRPIESPVLEGRTEGLDFTDWAVTRMTPEGVVWNTDKVPADQAPTSYEDLIDPKWKDQVMLEPRSYDWFMTLWTYFEDQGKSEDEITDYFEKLAANARVVETFPLQNEFLTTGEMSIGAGAYVNLGYLAQQKGAPIAFKPFVDPVIVDPSGLGLVKNAKAPALALLFAEYFLTDAQDLLSEQGRVPPKELQGGGVLDGAHIVVIDPEKLAGGKDKEWRDRYEKLLEGRPTAS